jgi:hypothetical protein
VPNKANLPRLGPKRHRLPGRQVLPPLGTSAPNKANCARVMGGTSALWNKSYSGFDLQGASAKQSQFAHGQQWTRVGIAASSAGGAGCTNKANFPTRPQMDAGRWGGCSGTLRQTHPICRKRARKTIAKARGLDAATHRGASAPNEANLARRQVRTKAGKVVGPAPGGTNRAKRSQFRRGDRNDKYLVEKEL